MTNDHCGSHPASWVDALPARWRVVRLKTVADYFVSSVDKVPSEDELPIRLLNYTDVYYNDSVTPDMGLMETTATAEEIRRFGLRVGDVVITKDSEDWRDIAIPTLVTASADDLVCGYHLAVVRPDQSRLNGAFLLRAFQSSAVNQQFRLASTGVTRFGLPKSAIGEAVLPLPPLDEQRAITAFLDVRTAMIAALIARERTLIARLGEKRQALIERAVTHGLPPTAAGALGLEPNPKPRKARVESIDDVPEHWEIVRLGRKITLQRGVDITKDEQGDGDVPVVSSGGVSSYHDRALVAGPGVVVGRKGSAGSVHYVDSDFWPHDTTLYVKEFRGNHPRFVYYKLIAMNLSSFDTGSSNPTVNRNLVHPVLVSWPPVAEQQAIAAFLDSELSRIGRMIDRIESAIASLREYRAALISAAITGNIDLRKAGRISLGDAVA